MRHKDQHMWWCGTVGLFVLNVKLIKKKLIASVHRQNRVNFPSFVTNKIISNGIELIQNLSLLVCFSF